MRKTKPIFGDLFERFAKYVHITDTCWNWQGFISEQGYGQLAGYRAHRVAYTLFKGEIPRGKVIDHLCFNKRCVNPNHLEAVTDAINTRRSWVARGYVQGTTKINVSIDPAADKWIRKESQSRSVSFSRIVNEAIREMAKEEGCAI